MRPISKLLAIVALSASVAVSAACSSSSGPSDASSGSTAGGTSAAGGQPSATGSLAKAYAGLRTSLPTSPTAITKSTNFWVVSCGQVVETCSTPAAAAVAAARSIGWQTHLCDGQLNPGGVSSCIRQAVAAKASAVDVEAFDCPKIKQALVEANGAGVKTVSGGGFDCAELGGSQVFAGTVHYAAGLTNHQWWAMLGTLQADWLIGSTDGKAKVLSLKFTDEAWGADIQNAFLKELGTCSGCSVVKTLEIGNADVQDGALRTKFSTALLQAPTANAVNVPVDGWFPAGLAQAVTSSGRASKLKVIGGIGQTANMGYIAGGQGENATAAFSIEQTGWASVDVAARLLAGQTAPGGQFNEGIGIQVVDKTKNLPAKGRPYQPPVDYRAIYQKLWTVG